MQRAPLVPVALALMGGIAAARHLLPQPSPWLWGMAVCALLTGLCALLIRRHLWPTTTGAMLFCCALGGALMSSTDRHDWAHACPEQAYLHVRLSETPQPRTRSWRTRADVLTVDGQRRSGSVTLYLRNDSTAATLRYGDRLLLHAYPDTARHWVYTTADHYLMLQRDSTSLRARCEALRMRMLRRSQQGPLEPRHAALAEALALGWRADLDPDTQASFRDAGIAHLLAVSGLHVGVLAGLAGWLMRWTGKERRGRIVRGAVQLLAVWCFALLTGLSPSTARAALMFSLFIVANVAERRTPRMNLLAAAALLTLVPRPGLLFDTGWQLSYSAVAGILLARPVISAYRNRLWQATTVCIAATLATLPVTVATFHRLPLYFLVANVAIVPASTLLLAFALCYVALPCTLTAVPMGCAACMVENITSWVSALPGAVVEGLYPTPWGLAALTTAVAALLLASRWMGKRPKNTV